MSETLRKNCLNTLAHYHSVNQASAPAEFAKHLSAHVRLLSEMKTRPAAEAKLLHRILSPFALSTDATRKLLSSALLFPDATTATQAANAASKYFPLKEYRDHEPITVITPDIVTLRINGDIAFQPIADLLPPIERAKTVFLQINSPGGDTNSSLMLCEALKPKESVTATVFGYAFSAAATILQAATHRQMTANSMLMVHSAVGFGCGSPAQLRRDADETEKANGKIIPLFHRSNPDDVKRWFAGDKDFYFKANEALSAGLVDQILPEPTGEGDAGERVARELITRLRGLMDEGRFAALMKEFVGGCDLEKQTEPPVAVRVAEPGSPAVGGASNVNRREVVLAP